MYYEKNHNSVFFKNFSIQQLA